jgi:hypothetical protein
LLRGLKFTHRWFSFFPSSGPNRQRNRWKSQKPRSLPCTAKGCRAQGAAFPPKPRKPGLPRTRPSPCRLRRPGEDEERGPSCFSFPVALIRCPRPLPPLAFPDAPSRPGPSSPAPLRAGPWMVRSARELGAGLAGDARALWPNTARTESKLPAQWGRASVRVCARVCERASAGRRGANCFTLSTLHGRERARETGDAQVPPRSSEATVPQIV